jgi:hypothetical protein
MTFFFLMAALFLFLGLGVHVFKWYFLISGYNTMSREKKAKVDIKGMARVIGIYSYFNSGVFFLAGWMGLLDIQGGMVISIVLVLASTGYMVIRSQRYDGNLFDEHGKLKKKSRRKYWIPIAILIVSLGSAGVLLVLSWQDPKVTLTNEGIEIHGIYGSYYPWEEISEVRELTKVPTITARTNGADFGEKKRGKFRTAEYGAVKLFIVGDEPPFIYLETLHEKVIFQMTSSAETTRVLERIEEEVT